MDILIWTGFGLIFLVTLMTYFSNIHSFVKAVTFGVLVLFGVLTYEHYIDVVGTPIEGYPITEFYYIGHINVKSETFLWIFDDRIQDHRLYSFPYTNEMAQQLEEMRESKSKKKYKAERSRATENVNQGFSITEIEKKGERRK